MVEGANKDVNRHVRHVCFDRRIKSTWRQTLPISQRIIDSHCLERTGVSPAVICSENWKTRCMPQNLSVPTRWTYLRLNRRWSNVIDKLSRRVTKHTLLKQKLWSTLFLRHALTYLLEPATGKQKDRLHSRKLGPFLIIWHIDKTYILQNLVFQKEVKVNVKNIHLFHFNEERVNPQEVAGYWFIFT